MKNYLLIISALVLMHVTILNNASAQVPAIQWQKNYGGSSPDKGYTVKQTSDGGYITAGESYSIDGDVTGNHGGTDYWILKSDSAGNIQWQKSLGGSGLDGASSVKQTLDGGYIVAGGAASADGDVSANYGDYDYWLVKLDNGGAVQWQKNYGGSGYEYPFSVMQTSDGGYLTAGFSSSNDSDVTGNHGALDCWILKTDSAGTVQWQKSLGSFDYDFANSIMQDDDGGYVFCGAAGANGGDVTGNHGSSDVWLVKLDAAGALVWQKCYGGTDWEAGNTLVKTTDGGYIIACQAYSIDGDVTGNHGMSDFWVIKTDSVGNLQWQKSLGGTADDIPTSIVQTADGGYVLCGSTVSVNGDVTNNHGGTDAWVIKLDSTGNIQAQKCFGGTNDDIGNWIEKTIDGEYILAGQSTSSDGDLTSNYGAEDYWMVKLSSMATGIAENTFKKSNLNVFPNPVESGTAFASFNLEENADVNISLNDLTGKVIRQQALPGLKGDNIILFDFKNISSGVYVLSLKNGKESVNTKIIVE